MISLSAHEDPLGDVQPEVRVERGNFALYFSNNTQGTLNDHSGFLVRYSPEGKLLAPRQKVKEIPPVVAAPTPYAGGGDVYSSVLDGTLYTMPRRNSAQPTYFIQAKSGIERHRLPWATGTRIEDVADFAVDSSGIWISAKPKTANVLMLYHFALGSVEVSQEKNLGRCAFIYSFAVASNLVLSSGSCQIAWCRVRGDDKTELVLSRWTPSTGACSEVVLDPTVDFNLHISMAAIGDRLMIAYHHSKDGSYPGDSSIATIFRKLD